MVTPLEEAMQATLAGEHAAIYVYGVLSGRVSTSASPTLAGRLHGAYIAHRRRRDQLTARLRALGGSPVATEVSYVVPTPGRTPAQLTSAAAVVERRCAAVYSAMVASTTGVTRGWAIDALADAAVRELNFGAEPQAFPGAPEL